MPYVQKISAKQLNELREGDTPFFLIDVREKDEWDGGHINGAVHIPLQTLSTEILKQVPDKKSKIVLYCASGRRSQAGSEYLVLIGYEDVSNLDGGYGSYSQK